MKTIRMQQIKRIFELDLEIFNEEDSDRPDRRVIAPKERAIDRILCKITSDKVEQAKIYNAIAREKFRRDDRTYKPICDNLRWLGYKIEFSGE